MLRRPGICHVVSASIKPLTAKTLNSVIHRILFASAKTLTAKVKSKTMTFFEDQGRTESFKMSDTKSSATVAYFRRHGIKTAFSLSFSSEGRRSPKETVVSASLVFVLRSRYFNVVCSTQVKEMLFHVPKCLRGSFREVCGEQEKISAISCLLQELHKPGSGPT